MQLVVDTGLLASGDCVLATTLACRTLLGTLLGGGKVTVGVAASSRVEVASSGVRGRVN